MSEIVLGSLEPVVIREVWSHEAGDFTPWLARPENLKRLGEVLGMDLQPEQEEVSVGPFFADILCKNTAEDNWVLIENQIEKTDHRHLGQILTYAAGLNASTLVWIATKFTEEHRAVLDWLNENTSDNISFFGIEIEVWKIGNSLPAPKFSIISKPNDWSKAIKSQAAGTSDGSPSANKRLQFEFWTAFKEYLTPKTSLTSSAPAFRHWLTFSIGKSGFRLAAVASLWNTISQSYDIPELRVELLLDGVDASENYSRLEAIRPQIETQLGIPFVWYAPEAAKIKKIYVRRDGDFRDKAYWPEQFQWLLSHLEKFHQVFHQVIREI